MKLIDVIQDSDLPVVFSTSELVNVLKGSDASRYARVKRGIAEGSIIHLRRGLYAVSKKYSKKISNLFWVAQKIYGPSYVSFESALSYHGWIPESVPTISSACSLRSKTFNTPYGLFEYYRIPSKLFYSGVDRIVIEKEVVFIASPWKAIVDYVYLNQNKWRGLNPLIKSLRIDGSLLVKTSKAELEEISESFGKRNIKQFIDSVIKDLNL